MRYQLGFIIVLMMIWLTGCKLSDTNVIESNLPQPKIDSIRTFAVNDFIVKLDQYGIITGYQTLYQTNLSGGGLWIGMEQDGQARANIVRANWNRFSNYIARLNNKQYGVFYLESLTNYSSDNWPVSYGAPVTSSGKPLVYGDAMCWQTLFSDTTKLTDAYMSKPIKGLRVTQALYGYQNSNYRNVIFVRYNITNTTSKPWNNIYLGFWSDTDLYSAYNNQTGYDSTRSLTYTYASDNFNVEGFTFLQTPGNNGVTSSRIMRKNSYIDPDFGEITMSTPVQILYVLKGLSNSGLPMINPVTGNATKFAFTGDPVRQTGWLDSPIDTRNIISSGPFNLNAGETTTVTVAWVAANGINLADALTSMKEKIDLVRQNRSLWQFPN